MVPPARLDRGRKSRGDEIDFVNKIPQSPSTAQTLRRHPQVGRQLVGGSSPLRSLKIGHPTDFGNFTLDLGMCPRRRSRRRWALVTTSWTF